ncbi:eukaryotic translation initiation factor 3 subunit G-like [Papaver somniferum]|uniref:eukaryotic translation initiation factor 3 subunit G-like n=1 Tax=Papaver somniferum TaxID=3469 RepID=UPI000E6F78C0|nr:eukaryotic translation initiation factor 3 subunit G-like [Papaver somniferum]
MSTDTMQRSGSVRWGDLEEDDGQDLDLPLPPPAVSGPHSNLIKKTIERRSWTKFGDAVHEDVGAGLTTVSTEEVRLERPRPPGSKDDTWVLGDPLARGTSRPGTYIPPGQRDGARQVGSQMRPRRKEENSVRVTNLSENTREPDLLELFRRFGAVSRVYIPVDRRTGKSRGFAFVNFVNKVDAERAINVLNGYGYDNLILGVGWATPREN